jgi:hypothetical protein
LRQAFCSPRSVPNRYLALKAAKDRGQRLGKPRLDEVRHPAAAATREAADRFAENTLPIVRQIQAIGVTSLRAIAVALAARGIPTARGGAWNAMQVSNLLSGGAAVTPQAVQWPRHESDRRRSHPCLWPCWLGKRSAA